MAVRSKEELLNSIKARIGDDTSDEALALVEDISDTYDDMETKVTQSGDWKQKYEDNDKEWREKYRDRFYSGVDSTDVKRKLETEPETEETKPMNFEDLFKTE